jgi:hypothetical protein
MHRGPFEIMGGIDQAAVARSDRSASRRRQDAQLRPHIRGEEAQVLAVGCVLVVCDVYMSFVVER